MIQQGQYKIIRCNGTEELVNEKPTLAKVYEAIKVDCIDTVIITKDDGFPACCMLCDDTGMIDGKPVNQKATEIMRKRYDTPYSIHGDVVLVHDLDFG